MYNKFLRKRQIGIGLINFRQTEKELDGKPHRCKKNFFYFGHVFYVLNVFLFSELFVFFYLKNVGKVQSGKQINKKHFQNNSNEIQWVRK